VSSVYGHPRVRTPNMERLVQSGVHSVRIGEADVYRPGAELGFSEMLLPGDRCVPGDTNHGRRPLSIRQGSAARADGFGPREDAGAVWDRMDGFLNARG